MEKMITKKLQSLSLSEHGKEELYFRTKFGAEFTCSDNCICSCGDGMLTFDTYFNSFSIGKWMKYTCMKNLSLLIEFTGEWEVTLIHGRLSGGKVIRTPLSKKRFKSTSRQQVVLTAKHLPKEGIIYPLFRSMEAKSVIHDFSYQTTLPKSQVRKIGLAIDICTFCREKYVMDNIERIRTKILDCPSSPLYKKTFLYVVDNGQTLDLPQNMHHPAIKVYQNKNTGGAGGFTRGIVEALDEQNEKGLTHILLMDDDVVIEPHVLEKMCVFLSILKKDFRDSLLGGGLLRLDSPCIQYESGGQWNGGSIKALKHNVDLRDFHKVLENEETTEAPEYTGWWFTCLPMTAIDRDNLPLPLFIHRDDIEYGLRIGAGNFITMNGIGVWHEAFENKMPGLTEYYDVRNLAIVNALHFPKFTKKDFKKFLFKWVSGNIARYRYRYAALNLRAAADFCKGFSWFCECDGEALHKELAKLNYHSVSIDEMAGYHGITREELLVDDAKAAAADTPHKKFTKILKILSFNGYFFPARAGKPLVVPPHSDIYRLYRQKEIIYADTGGKCILAKRSVKQLLRCYFLLFQTFRVINKHYEAVKKQYHDGSRSLTSHKFWESYLDINSK